MSTRVEGPTRAFVAGAALSIYRRVRLAAGVLAYASDTDTDYVGVLEEVSLAANQVVSVRLRTSKGTILCEASEAISAGASGYAAANGRVAASGTVLIGTVLTDATAEGDWIEVLESSTTISGTLARASILQEDLKPYPLPLNGAKVWNAPAKVLPIQATSDTHPIDLTGAKVWNAPTTALPTQSTSKAHPIDLTECKVWDAASTVIPVTPANDDLGLIDNTFKTAAPSVETGDLKSAGATTRKTRFVWRVPHDYVAGHSLTLRINAGMKTTVADATATVDAEVVRRADPSADICATAAQSINNLVAANIDFTITATAVVPGDILDCVVSVAVNDGGGGNPVIGKIYSIVYLADAMGDDLGVVDNTFKTAVPTLETPDVKALGAKSYKARLEWTVPQDYVAAHSLTLRVNAGMKTTVSDTTATVDAEVVRRAAPNVDVCATAAQSINSLVAADLDFTITATSVVPGDVLDIVLTVAVNDAATATVVIGQVNSATVLADAMGDDLGVVDNTFGMLAPTLETPDVKALGAKSYKARYEWTVPPEYVAGQTLTLRVNAGMKTTVADTTATVDAEVVRRADPSADICATAAQSINSLVAANKDFTITPTNVVVGDVLDIVLTVAVNDAATGTAVIGQVNNAIVLADIKG